MWHAAAAASLRGLEAAEVDREGTSPVCRGFRLCGCEYPAEWPRSGVGAFAQAVPGALDPGDRQPGASGACARRDGLRPAIALGLCCQWPAGARSARWSGSGMGLNGKPAAGARVIAGPGGTAQRRRPLWCPLANGSESVRSGLGRSSGRAACQWSVAARPACCCRRRQLQGSAAASSFAMSGQEHGTRA